MVKMNSLHSMFSPKSIAIIGASGDPNKLSYKPLSNLNESGYEGKVYLVNPRYKEIEGFPCFEDVSSLPLDIDLALIAVNASAVQKTLQKLYIKNVKSVVILSSGYSEIGDTGEKLEQELTEFSRKTGIPICGPNSLGIANFSEKVIVSFSSMKSGKVDPIAFVTQSGAIGSLSYTFAQELGIGYHQFVSSGNEASLDFFDYVDYFAKDEKIKVIGGYLEGARDFKKMQKALDTCKNLNKPLVLMKVGNSVKGAEAARSHTSSLAGNAEIYKNYLKHKNVVRVSDEEELTDTLAVFTKTNRPAKSGGVAVISQSGGAGIIMVDQCEKKKIKLAELTDKTRRELKKILPEFSTTVNPIDMTPQINQTPSQIVEVTRVTLEDENVESVVLYFQMTNENLKNILPEIEKLAQSTKKILILCWSGIQTETKEIILKHKGICWLPNPTRTINALANVVHYYKEASFTYLNKLDDQRITSENIKEFQNSTNEWESKLRLKEYGVSVPEGQIIQTDKDLTSIELNYPIVMKALSTEIEHKSDYGLVRLNISSKEDAENALKEIIQNKNMYCADKKIEGILIEEMAPKGVEVIIGAIYDDLFGPCIMFGLGGVFVEVMNDIVVMPTPLTKEIARKMVESIKSYSILKGARSNVKYDIDSLVDTLVRISEFCEDHQDYLAEIDINPLVVHEEGKGVTAVDALIIGNNSNKL